MLTGRTILLADDETFITSMVASKLAKLGATAIVASDGKQAFALAKARKPDLIVTDYQMPEMTGLELATALKQAPETNSIPVLMLTARGHRLTPTELALTNIRSVLSKPFSCRELLDAADQIFVAAA